MELAKYRAYLCCGINCGPKGASALVSFLEAELERRGLTGVVSVASTGCQAHCESGPTMVVYPGPVFYQGMTEERLARITQEHLSNGIPVSEFFWTGVRRRILANGTVIMPKNVILPEYGDPGATIHRQPKQRKPPPDVDDFKW
jgi:(2Fe-2S) ferredoxin